MSYQMQLPVAFNYIMTTSATDVTGDSTFYEPNFNAMLYDTYGNLVMGDAFVAPIDGIYEFTGNITCTGS